MGVGICIDERNRKEYNDLRRFKNKRIINNTSLVLNNYIKKRKKKSR